MSDKKKGTVKWFNGKKGYGFIKCDMGDVFVHYNAIKMELGKRRVLYENDYVEFNLQEGEKGFQANDVVLLKRESLGGSFDGASDKANN